MAAEALAALGHPALIEGLVDVYAPRVPPLRTGAAIPPDQREGALGDPSRLPDWVATYDREVEQRPWPELLSAQVDHLLPGLFAGSAHGLLRVAHGVRGLEEADTPARRRELAMGLAYWAGRYQELPGTPSADAQAGQGVRASFDRVGIVLLEKRRPGLFSDAVRVLEEDADFARVVAGFDPGEADLGAQISEICRVSAHLYLAHPGARIAYVHCLTAPSSLRLFAHRLDPVVARRAVGYALQAALALHAVSASGESEESEMEGETSAETRRLAGDIAEIRYRAACSLEEHAIKFAEACLRENASAPDPVFTLAAADAVTHLDTGAGRGGRR
jgi:hypothetical protein